MNEIERLIAEFLFLVDPLLTVPLRNQAMEKEIGAQVQPILDEMGKLLGVEGLTLGGILEVYYENGQVNVSLN